MAKKALAEKALAEKTAIKVKRKECARFMAAKGKTPKKNKQPIASIGAAIEEIWVEPNSEGTTPPPLVLPSDEDTDEDNNGSSEGEDSHQNPKGRHNKRLEVERKERKATPLLRPPLEKSLAIGLGDSLTMT